MNKRGQILSVARSPWVLITIPAILGGMWLILHPEIITNNLDKPYALAAGPVTIASVLAAWAIIAFFKVIASWCKSTWKTFTEWKKKDGSSFWIVIYVFLIVSVLESGTFFNILLGVNSLFDTMGYASALVIDLVAVECMQARLHAVRMRDKRGALLYLVGVITCASISAFANGFTALMHWHEPTKTAIPEIMIHAAPTIGVIFPLLMIFLSFAGDYTADRANTKLDPDDYKDSEDKRIRLLEIQRDMLRSRIQIEQEIDQMTRRGGKSPGRTFFLFTWLFPRDPLSMQAVVTTVTEEIRKVYDTQFIGLTQQVSSQLRLIAEQTTQSSQSTIKELQVTLTDLTSGHSSTSQQLSILTKQIELITESHGHFKDEIESTLTTTVSEQIATALQSHNIPDEVTISEQIAAAIQDYTIDQTDEHSTPIEGEKPLYPFYTPELKDVVTRFPNVDSWIRAGQRTVSLQDIVAATNFSVQFIGRHANDGAFTGTKTENVYTTKSVVNWLKTNPSPKRKNTRKAEQTTEQMDALPQEQNLQYTEELSANNERMSDLLTSATTPKFWSQDTDAIPATNGHAEEQVELSNYSEALV